MLKHYALVYLIWKVSQLFKRAHNKYQHKTVATKVLTTFLALILALNNFIFISKFYLQIKGCSMGTICAPAYANIFMAHFEEEFIYPLIIWIKSEEELIEFLNELNTKCNSIQFEFKYSRQQHPFSLKNSIAYSEALRIKRICSTRKEFNKHSSNLLQQLVKKGYHYATLKEQIDKARVEDRTLLLNKTSQKVKRNIPTSIHIIEPYLKLNQ